MNPQIWTATATGTPVPPSGTLDTTATVTIDFRPYQQAQKIGEAFTDLIKAMLDTERHLEAMRGRS